MTCRCISVNPAYHTLLCAVCNQAIVDYFLLRRAGAIRWGKAIELPLRAGHYTYVYRDMSNRDVFDLVNFIQNDMHKLLCMAGMDVDARDVVRRVLQLERTGEGYDFIKSDL